MIRINQKTLEDLEFPSVLNQVSERCITDPGKKKALEVVPFASKNEIKPELLRVKEFTASFNSDGRIPNHGFEPIFKELQLLDIENSTLEVSGFRRILTISETTKTLRAFFKNLKNSISNFTPFQIK